MSRMISALIKRPGEMPRHVNVSGRLDSLQKNVGGVMQVVQLATDLVALCRDRRFDVDEEAPYNCTLCGKEIYGTLVMVGLDKEGFADLPCEWKILKLMWPELWEKDPSSGGCAATFTPGGRLRADERGSSLHGKENP